MGVSGGCEKDAFASRTLPRMDVDGYVGAAVVVAFFLCLQAASGEEVKVECRGALRWRRQLPWWIGRGEGRRGEKFYQKQVIGSGKGGGIHRWRRSGGGVLCCRHYSS